MYFFIVNPHSGNGKGEKIWKTVSRYLDREQTAYQFRLTEKVGDAREFARTISQRQTDAQVIVAVGGDGTFNEVLDGLSFSGKFTVGLIPAGSGNDLARSLRIPEQPIRALKRVLRQKHLRTMDYGVMSYGTEAQHRRFGVSMGIGMDALICQDRNLRAAESIGRRQLPCKRASYLFHGIRELALAKPCKGYVILDQVRKLEFNHIFFISVHIHPFEGGGFRFAPAADCSDGKFTVYVASFEKKRRLVRALCYSLFHPRKNAKMKCFECSEVSIYMERPQSIHTDGESLGQWQTVQAQCIEKKIRMIV